MRIMDGTFTSFNSILGLEEGIWIYCRRVLDLTTIADLICSGGEL